MVASAALQSQLLTGTFTELGQSIFKIKSRPLTYVDQDYMVTAVDDLDYEMLLMRTSRQIGKSISQGVRLVLSCLQIPSFAALYVSPSHKQTKRFSRKCLDPFCKESPFVREYMMDKACIWSTEMKEFRNKSSITLHYAFHTADRSRGESMDLLAVDELQDMDVDNIPVLEQTLVHSKPPEDHPEWGPFYKKKMYTGTPKSLSGTLEHYWKESNQCVWKVPCHACGGWNQLTEKNIGKHGTICSENATYAGGERKQCARPIDPREGVWQSLNSKSSMGILGIHVSQLMVPRVEWGPHGWIRWDKDILAPFEGRAPGWDKVRFQNEILGYPCESAMRMVTQADIMACCDDKWRLVDSPTPLTQSTSLFAGLDWGEGRSRTVLVIGGHFSDGRWAPVFIRVYHGDENDPDFLLADILKWINWFGVRAVSPDVGHGFGLNSQLIRELGMDRVLPIRYGMKCPRLAMMGKKKWEWTSARSMVIGELAMDIKRKRLRLPAWEQFQHLAPDLLAEFLEFSGRHRDLHYTHSPNEPDDLLHAIIYARLCEELARGSFVSVEEPL